MSVVEYEVGFAVAQPWINHSLVRSSVQYHTGSTARSQSNGQIGMHTV
jgi:hypothetical protein